MSRPPRRRAARYPSKWSRAKGGRTSSPEKSSVAMTSTEAPAPMRHRLMRTPWTQRLRHRRHRAEALFPWQSVRKEQRPCKYYPGDRASRHGTMASMRVGLSIDPPLAAIPALLAEESVDAFQTVLRDPGRFGNYGVPEPGDRAALIEGLRGRDAWGVAHGSLLINLASPEGRIRNSSVSSLLADLKVAAEVGLAGVCFHVGYAKGHPSAEAALVLATRKRGELLERTPAGPRLLLENSCEGSELGQTVAELARLL